MPYTFASSPETSHRWAQPDTAPISVPADIRFSIWVSFFEIYNELLYDLLEPPSQQRKRQVLRLCEDQNGNPYVKGIGKRGGWHEPWRGLGERLGRVRYSHLMYTLLLASDLNWIHVQDAEEAWKLLKVGRKNQSFASTHLNQNSSRR